MLTRLAIARRLARKAGVFGACRRAVAGVEFALVTPFLITLFLGTVETARYLSVQKKVQNAAADIALALSASDAEITGATLWQHYAMLPVLVPDVISDMRLSGETDWSQQARMNVTFVVANTIKRGRCGTRCKSRLNVLWSYGRDRRACGEWRTVSRRVKNGLPRLFYDEGQNFFAVEIRYTFQPLFLTFLKGAIELEETFYAPPKYFDEIGITKMGDADVRLATDCSSELNS